MKPVMILYGLSFSVSSAVTTQLWLDRTCSVNLGFNETVCAHLTDKEYKDFESQVQATVSHFNIAGSYMEKVPTVLIGLYLGTLL